MDNRQLTRLAVRACRIAFRNIGGGDPYQEEVARRIQEVWEDEGVDLASLATFDCEANDADHAMRRYYRQKNDFPEEMHCDYCGEYVETDKALAEKFCTPKCQKESAEFHEKCSGEQHRCGRN